MKSVKRQPMMRDRTYSNVEDGDYLTPQQYLAVATALLVTHFLLQVFYIWLHCTPMIIINIVSIFTYIVSIGCILVGHPLVTVWIMVMEIFLHVIVSCIFLGMRCGYQLWLFGTLSTIFMPFFLPDMSGLEKKQMGLFSTVVIGTFMALTYLDSHGLLPTKYNAPLEIAKGMYYINAALSFTGVMVYAAAYSARMKAKNKELKNAADHDFLTGIFNRQRLQKILDAEIARAQEQDDVHLMVAIADIDFFKNINDEYGHIVGDEALKELADIFTEYFEKGLLYGRWGGEEFMLIAPENMSYTEFGAMLEKIRKQVEGNELKAGDKTIKFTISVGAAAYEKGMTSEQLVNSADDRLYRAKETGRNKVVY